ncbi:hypothetical protein WA026_013992 [Henosepilachna vigintioctopunctata]|uniref:Uncharacterized protein n=1 Tax=Henosepilachna vigintioctopunctata TaxID=420089 RepID=A0AAW1UBE5_9CUCU
MANKGEKSPKYEPDTSKSYGSGVQDSVTQNLMATLLKGGLAESIKTIVASETAKALKQFQSKSGEYASTSKASRVGGEILEPFDPDTKDCNIVKWLNVIDQLGEIHGWSEYERAFLCKRNYKAEQGAGIIVLTIMTFHGNI